MNDPTSTSEDNRRRGVFDVNEGRALDALRMSWGDVYDIGHEYDQWVASRRDGRGGTLEGATPDALNRALRADWGIR
jgi:hypothetical protein